MKKAFRNSECYREIPTMTRSQYIEEYTEITEWAEKERKTIKKFEPICKIVAIVWVIIIFIAFINGVDVIWYNFWFHLSYGRDAVLALMSIPFIPTFPYVSILIRLKRIKKKEDEKIKDLDFRKGLCISMGTYKAEE